MSMTIVRHAAIAALSLIALAAQAQPEARPGEYAYSVKVKMMGMTMPAIDFKQCVTAKDIADGKAYVNTEKQADCSDTKLQWSGNDFTVASTCKNPDRTMSGKGTATAETFELKMDVVMGGGMPMTQKQTVSAKRLGDCAAK
ncbi:MAG: DUF3617 family protein [Pseudomonadota bacterium]